MTWQKEMRRNEHERNKLTAELKRGNREINQGLRELEGWSNRIMDAVWGFAVVKEAPRKINNQNPF